MDVDASTEGNYKDGPDTRCRASFNDTTEKHTYRR